MIFAVDATCSDGDISPMLSPANDGDVLIVVTTVIIVASVAAVAGGVNAFS